MFSGWSFRSSWLFLAIGVFVGLVIAAGFNLSHSPQDERQFYDGTNLVLGSQQAIPQQILALKNTSDAFVYIAERVVPTVVTIESSRLISTSELQKFHDRDELRDFFRFRVPDELRQQGSGSGIIVSPDGFILTNVHVVDKADRVRVVLQDNREYDASIVGLDPLTEVAVVKIAASDLPVAPLGNSDSVRVGEWVLAIGNPLELRSTVTAGIISAKEREIDIIDDTYSVESFLQTDAAINPGNSGGALVNLNGQVVGVNTAIATETGYSAGFGFAIPINLAKKIMFDLIDKGRVDRGYLGIAMQNIDEKRARALSMDKPRGVFIDRVLRGSPAAEAGVRSKDVVLQVDTHQVTKSNQVQALIAKKSPGESVVLRIWRSGREMDLDVVLGRRQETIVTHRKPTRERGPSGLGLTVESLTRERASEMKYTGPLGVIVTGVVRLGPADDSGIMEDDIIVEIDDTRIESAHQFQESIQRLEPGGVVILTLSRFNETIHVFLEVPPHE